MEGIGDIMDKQLESFSNEQLLKAIIHKALIQIVETNDILLDEDSTKLIMDKIYRTGEVIDEIYDSIYNKLLEDDDYDCVDETNYNPYTGQDEYEIYNDNDI